MALHPALRQLIDAKLAHTRAQQWELPIEEVRRGFRALWTPAITGEPVSLPRIQDIAIPGPAGAIPARVYAPDATQRCPLMLYFHGGGYVKGGLAECDAFCRNLARVARHAVLSIDYRLAPEHRFPAALDDVIAATTWVAAHAGELGARPGPIVLCGESAGGNLAAVACAQLRSNPYVAIRHQVLLQPVIDFTLSYPSIGMPATECLVSRADLAWYYRTYSEGLCAATDPRVSPIFADDLAGLPPALIIAAEYDSLRDEAKAYAGRLQAAGIAARYVCPEGMVHGFLQMRGLVSDAQTATEEIARFLN